MPNENATNGYKDRFYQDKLKEHNEKLKELASEMSSLKESHAVIEYATQDLKTATEKIHVAVDRLDEKLVNKMEKTIEKEIEKHTVDKHDQIGYSVPQGITSKQITGWSSIIGAALLGVAAAIKVMFGL